MLTPSTIAHLPSELVSDLYVALANACYDMRVAGAPETAIRDVATLKEAVYQERRKRLVPGARCYIGAPDPEAPVYEVADTCPHMDAVDVVGPVGSPHARTRRVAWASVWLV